MVTTIGLSEGADKKLKPSLHDRRRAGWAEEGQWYTVGVSQVG